MVALDLLDVLARLLHVAGVVVWMGHNWANVVVNPTFRPAGPITPHALLESKVVAAMKREHGIFRYASLVVLASGVYMLWRQDVLADALLLHGSWAVLGLGVWCGIAMVANLWFVLWPHQKKVLGFIEAPDDERIRCSRITFLSSRTNTMLSFPTLFLMIAGAHGALPL